MEVQSNDRLQFRWILVHLEAGIWKAILADKMDVGKHHEPRKFRLPHLILCREGKSSQVRTFLCIAVAWDQRLICWLAGKMSHRGYTQTHRGIAWEAEGLMACIRGSGYTFCSHPEPCQKDSSIPAGTWQYKSNFDRRKRHYNCGVHKLDHKDCIPCHLGIFRKKVAENNPLG